MNTIKFFLNNTYKYREYLINSIYTGLASEYADSYLGYIWWVLDPILFMFIYVFVVQIILGRGGPQFPVFVFCALLFWRWTSHTLSKSVKSISSAKNILDQTYVPKFIFPLVKTIISSFYFLISIVILLVMLVIYQIPFTLHIFEFVPIFIVTLALLLGMNFWLAHLGVYFYDTDRILTFVLRFWYYVSPGLYTIDQVPGVMKKLIWINPLTTIFISSRNVFMYGQSPVYMGLLIWLIFAIFLIFSGLRVLQKFDRTYTKIY